MRRWLFVAVFVTLVTAFFGLVWSTALVLATVPWSWMALGLAIAGLVGLVLVVSVGALGMLGGRLFQGATATVSLFCVLFFALRFVHPFYPTAGAVGFFAASYALAFGAMGSFFGIIDTVAPIMRRLPLNARLLGISLAGQFVGAAGGLLGLAALTPGAVIMITFLGSFVSAILLAVQAMRRRPQIRSQLSRAEQATMAKTLRNRYSLVTSASVTSFVGFGLLGQGFYLVYRLLQESVRFDLSQWGGLFAVLFGCGALAAIVVLGLSRLWLWRQGAFGLIVLYPCLMLIPLVWWFVNPNETAAALLTALFHAALLPSLFLPTLRYALTPIPKRFLARTGLMAGAFSGALGLFVGGIAWFLLSPYVTLVILIRTTAALNIVLVGLAAGLALSYRWHWISRLRVPAWRFDARFMEHLEPSRIRELLHHSDPVAVELGLALVVEAHDPGDYLAQFESLLESPQPPGIASKLLVLLGRLSDVQIRWLLEASLSQLRARTVLAMVHHQVPIPLDRLSALLQDSSPWVRVVACIAAWRLGLEELAEVAWQTFSLATIGSKELIETCNTIGPGLSPSALVALRTFAQHPGAEVRSAALRAIADWVSAYPTDDQLLLDMATRAVTSEYPSVREAGVRLLAAIDPAKSAATLAGLLEDAEHFVRLAAAEGLAGAGSYGLELAQAALGNGCEETDLAAMLSLVRSGRIGDAAVERYLDRLNVEVRTQLPYLDGGGSGAIRANDAYLGLLRRYAWAAELRGELGVGYALKALAYFDSDWSEAATGTLGRWIVPNPLLAKATRLYRLRTKFSGLVQ